MCTHKSDIYHISNKDDYSDNPIVISSYVENIASILNIVPTKIEQSLHFCKLICDSVNFDE